MSPLMPAVRALLVLALISIAGLAKADSRFEAFTDERFQVLQAEGRTVVIDVWAP